jgi:hypothetical protein
MKKYILIIALLILPIKLNAYTLGGVDIREKSEIIIVIDHNLEDIGTKAVTFSIGVIAIQILLPLLFL